jgi:hypothetical protein
MVAIGLINQYLMYKAYKWKNIWPVDYW